MKKWKHLPILVLTKLVLMTSGCDNKLSSRTTMNSGAGGDIAQDSIDGAFQLMSPAQLAAGGHLCEPDSGPTADDTANACAGNNFIRVELDLLYPDLALTYNSTWPHDSFQIGKNWLLSEVATIFLDPNATKSLDRSWHRDGFGKYRMLRFGGDKLLSGSWVADARSEFSDYINRPKEEEVWQYAMDGTAYRFAKIRPNTYTLRAAIDRFGRRSEIQFGTDLKSEYLLFADNTRIAVTRGRGLVELKSSSGARAELKMDSSGRLIGVMIATNRQKIEHSFGYQGQTSLLTSHVVHIGGSMTHTMVYTYDSKGRLINLTDTATNQSIRLVRDAAARTLLIVRSSGITRKEIYDARGLLVRASEYSVGKPDQVFAVVDYTYDANGQILSEAYPDADVIYEYDDTHRNLLRAVTTSVAGKIVKEERYTIDPYSRIQTRLERRDAAGTLQEQVITEISPKRPFLPLAVHTHSDKTVRKFSYNANETKVETYLAADNSAQALLGTEKYLEDRLIAATGANDSESVVYTYDSQKLLTKKAMGKRVISYSYEKDRIKQVESTDGDKTLLEFDENGSVSQMVRTFASGVEDRRQIRRDYHPDGSLREMQIVQKFPAGRQDVHVLRFADRSGGGALVHQTLNDVPVYGEN